MVLQETYTLNNGVTIPKIAFGTWMINNKDVVANVQDAIKVGYRHIDTAQAYNNEKGVGEGIKASGVDRKDIFITTKLAAEAKSYKDAAKAIDKSLAALGVDYIDMMIIHSPQPWMKFGDSDRFYEGNREAWRALEEAYEAGKLKAIGLSNFQADDIDNILSTAKVKPAVNQVLAHISNTPFDLIDYSQKHGMLVEAYSPIAHGELMKNETVKAMAAKYKVSIPQLAIRYTLQLGLLPLPKTTKIENMQNNADVDFEISEADMEALKTIERIKDYGDANMMPVYSGEKLKLSGMVKMVASSLRKKSDN